MSSRYRLHRAGIHQVWQYDEVFHFADGRLLLRGKNGAGKSKALEMLLPFLLDGDTRRIDATGGGKTSLKWLMLDGWRGGTNRLGYLWVEFIKREEDGEEHRLLLGALIRASTSTGEARAMYFVTSQELPLPERPAPDRLRDLVGAANVYERASEYRDRVARELFGIRDPARYRNLVHLLYGLRRPTIGDRIESGELVKVLTEALPPLDDEVIDKVARNLDDLDSVRDELGRLERTDDALTTFLTAYRGYLRGVLRGRVGGVRSSLEELGRRRRVAGDAERLLTAATSEEREAAERLAQIETAREAADTDLRAIQASAAYQALDDLRQRRETVGALRGAAEATWKAAGRARSGEEAAARRLTAEAEDLGAELRDVRDAARTVRRTARACGLDEALVGEAPAPAADVLETARPETLTAPDGSELEIVRPSAGALRQEAGESLRAWRGGLDEARLVAKGRERAAKALRAELKEVAAAEREAESLTAEAERLEGEVDRARGEQTDRAEQLAATSATYAGEVGAWVASLDGVAVTDPVLEAVALPDDSALPPIERSLEREAPEAVARLAHEAVDPVLAELDGRRDDILQRERALAAERDEARAEKARWEAMTDPEPPRSPYSTAIRAAGAPFYLLVDFRPGLEPDRRAGLEAALEASGLLNAWVCADGTVLADDTRDVLLRPGDPVPGESLAAALTPTPAGGVGEEAVRRALRAIGLGPATTENPATAEDLSAAESWVTFAGRWRMGVTRGAHGKERAEYVGAGARARTRERRIAELAALIGDLDERLEDVRRKRAAVEGSRDALRTALRRLPAGRSLVAAWSAYDQAVSEVARLVTARTEARQKAEKARAAAADRRRRAHARAGTDGLPVDDEALVPLIADLGRLGDAVGALDGRAGRVLDRLAAHQETRSSWEGARADRVAAERDHVAAHGRLIQAERELTRLEESIGATEQEIMAREADSKRRLDAAERELPDARQAQVTARDERVTASVKRDARVEELEKQQGVVVEGGDGLRRPLGLPGLGLAAGIEDVDDIAEAYDAAQDGDVRARINALRRLADDVESRLGPVSADVSDSLILKRGEELRDGLAGGYDAAVSEVDGVKRFALHDDTGAHDVAVVGRRIRAAVDDARAQLTSREQEVFERYLLGELGDHLSRQVLTARRLVATMNETLDQVRSSHGIGARLVWELPPDSDADIKAAVALLRDPAALRTREQSAQLRDALRRRIEEARIADPAAGYATHLRVALDYRFWFVFKVRVTDAANPERERVLSHRTALSQGEQRVVSYLVLFATAAAHFTSVRDAAPHAPRLILLDDAFAKVDEPTHERLLGLLVELDLDFVITSERLWGCFATVPSLHIYECLRDPHVRGVATVHYRWDGRRRHLVPV